MIGFIRSPCIEERKPAKKMTMNTEWLESLRFSNFSLTITSKLKKNEEHRDWCFQYFLPANNFTFQNIFCGSHRS